MTEDEVKRSIRAHFGLRPDMKLFQNPCGNGWMGHDAGQYGGGVVLKNPRRLAFGLCPGSSDIIGWIVIDGRAVFLALEVKTDKGKPTPEQVNFIEQVRAHGGIAGVVRSVPNVEFLIHCYKAGLPAPPIK